MFSLNPFMTFEKRYTTGLPLSLIRYALPVDAPSLNPLRVVFIIVYYPNVLPCSIQPTAKVTDVFCSYQRTLSQTAVHVTRLVCFPFLCKW